MKVESARRAYACVRVRGKFEKKSTQTIKSVCFLYLVGDDALVVKCVVMEGVPCGMMRVRGEVS